MQERREEETKYVHTLIQKVKLTSRHLELCNSELMFYFIDMSQQKYTN